MIVYSQPNSGFTFYKMANLDNRISNADQLLTQVMQALLPLEGGGKCVYVLPSTHPGCGEILWHSSWTLLQYF